MRASSYLVEFVFRDNRRHIPIAAFETLLCLGALQPGRYAQIRHRREIAQTEQT
jgi:hypothetical protein